MRKSHRAAIDRLAWTGRALLLALSALVLFAEDSPAASVASKNREGNRLFGQGKYGDAEKAYLDAQAESPGRPELSYNMGNTRIKQKEYKDALKWLGQAMGKADKGLKEQIWYNSGNAMYEMGNFQDAIQSYIQALRINPADRDAKHNLELAWKKLEQQKQQGSGKNQKPDQNKPGDSEQNQQGGAQAKSSPDQKAQGDRPQQDRTMPANPQSTQGDRQERNFSKERALQILDALQNQELVDQRKLIERAARRKSGSKDW